MIRYICFIYGIFEFKLCKYIFIPKRFVMRYYVGYLYCLWLKCRPISPKALLFSFCYSTLSLLIVNSS